MKQEQIDIVCCLDDNFAQHCGVVMASVYENTKNKVKFHIVTDGLSSKSQQKLEDIAVKYGSSVNIYPIDVAKLNSCSIKADSHVSIATYFRILLPELLLDLDKVIYLDCDIIVRHDLLDLWQIDISNHAIGAAIDGTSWDIRNYNRLKYDVSLSYINAGVLLVNLKYWRDNNVVGRLLEYIDSYPERLLWWDQDAINGVLIKETTFIPIKYNMQDQFFHKNPMMSQTTLDEIDASIGDPTIVHFTTANKAWHKYSEHPFRNEYYKYLKLTPWKTYKPRFRPSMSISERLIRIVSYRILGRRTSVYKRIE